MNKELSKKAIEEVERADQHRWMIWAAERGYPTGYRGRMVGENYQNWKKEYEQNNNRKNKSDL